MDTLRAGKGLVLLRSGRMGRKRLCEPSGRVLGRSLALPTSTPSSCSLGKAQPRVSWSELHSAALSSMTGLKTHSPHRPLPEEQSSPPKEVSQNLPLVSVLFSPHYSSLLHREQLVPSCVNAHRSSCLSLSQEVQSEIQAFPQHRAALPALEHLPGCSFNAF